MRRFEAVELFQWVLDFLIVAFSVVLRELKAFATSEAVLRPLYL